MIVAATSGVNQCQYCVIAHGAILRIRANNSLITDQVAVNYRNADITARQKAMLVFVFKVTFEAHEADIVAGPPRYVLQSLAAGLVVVRGRWRYPVCIWSPHV